MNGAISDLLATVQSRLRAGAYAEDFVPMLIELEDHLANATSREAARSALFAQLEGSEVDPRVKSMIAFILGSKPLAETQGRLAQDLGRKPEVDRALILALGMVAERASWMADRRRSFWTSAFMDLEPVFHTGYERAFLVRKTGDAEHPESHLVDPKEMSELASTYRQAIDWSRTNPGWDPSIRQAVLNFIRAGGNVSAQLQALDLIRRGPDSDAVCMELCHAAGRDSELRRRALDSLSPQPPEVTWQRFSQLLQGMDLSPLRVHVLKSMADLAESTGLRSQETLERIKFELARGDCDAGGLGVLLRSIGGLGSEASESVLAELATSAKKAEVRMKCTEALAGAMARGDPRVQPRTVQAEAILINDSDLGVKKSATFALRVLVHSGGKVSDSNQVVGELERLKAIRNPNDSSSFYDEVEQLIKKLRQ